MDQELKLILRRYLAGDTSLANLEEFGASLDWNDAAPASRKLRAVLGHLVLLVEEVTEGLRDEDELRSFAGQTLIDLESPPDAVPSRAV